MNQRSPGYPCGPPCGALKMLRAYADPRIFRPLRKKKASFFCRRQRMPPFPDELPTARFHNESVGRLRRQILKLLHQRRKQLIVHSAHHRKNTVAVRLLEALCGCVQLKAVLLCKSHDFFTCVRADIRLIVECAGNCPDCIAGKCRKILDRYKLYPFTAPAATPLIMYFWHIR